MTMAMVSSFSTITAPSGYLLPSIHSAPPFFTQQPNPETRATFDEQWIRLILSYARHKRLFVIRVEDAETAGSDWDEVLRNEQINRKILPPHLISLFSAMVASGSAVYEPAKQVRSVLLYWRLPEEWADTLHAWAVSTGQLNTIMTFYEIVEPPVESALSGIPISLLRRAIQHLVKKNRAQIISISDGEGVRFFSE